MKRELAGVVACLQEIEIACKKLETREGLKNAHEIPEILGLIRGFFRSEDVEKAREVEARLVDLQVGFRDEGGENLISAEVEVDGIRTTLGSLRIELDEVLEDLG